MDNVELKSTDTIGKVVVARKDLIPGASGLEAFHEKALIIFPQHGSRKDISGPSPWLVKSMDQHWTNFWWYCKQSKEIQEKVMTFYVEKDCLDANRTREFATKYFPFKQVEAFVHLLLVMKFNAVTVQPCSNDGSGAGKTLGYGLFEIACRLTHSCRPNCVWFSSPDGSEKIIRIIQPILTGEMLTVDYIGYLEKPTISRGLTLLTFKNFVCICRRCNSVYGDDCRRFHCEAKECCGVHFIDQRGAASIPVLLPCVVCNRRPSDRYTSRMLKVEKKAQQEVETIERILDSGLRVDITHRVEALNPPHPHHSIAMEVFKLHFELHSQRGDLAAAAKAQCQFIACHKAIHGEDYRNEALGFAYERLGGIHERARNWSGAEDAYKEAVQILQLNRGCMSQPYSRCAIEKLVCVQNQNSSIADYQRCGLCGIDAPRKCSRCGETHYCCREHPKAHWVVHRKICKRI